MRRIIVSFVLFMAMLLICGAAPPPIVLDTITQAQPVANPGGKAQTLDGSGGYTLGSVNGVQNTLSGVSFIATNANTKQVNGIATTAKNGNWNGTLAIVAGTYNCYGVITSTNTFNGQKFKFTRQSNTIYGVQVK